MQIELNWSRCRMKPFAHQREGIKALVQHKVFALFDEMGAGKTKQEIDADCFLADAGEIDTVVVVAPASVRAVWAGEFGEIQKHAFFPSLVQEYHAKTPRLHFDPRALNWVVTNFEFIRSAERLDALVRQLNGRRVKVVIDESSRIKSPKAAQTKAVLKLGKQPFVARRVILNGTPISNNPLDVWAQLEFLDPAILGAKNYFWFRARYAVMGGYMGKQVIGWQNLEDLQRRIAPFCLRRLKVDCLDLPDKVFTVREARLSPETWKLYKQMRDQCVAWLDQNTAATAAQTVVRIMRLSQITAGFIGGFEQVTPGDLLTPAVASTPIREIGREKLDAFLEPVEEMLAEDPALHLLVWCRFRAELARAERAVRERFPHVWTGTIQGDQKEADRREIVNTFQSPANGQPRIIFGNPQAGGLGLTLTAAHRVVYMSNDFNLVTRLQSEDRVHRPGQTHKVLYTDVVAVGPDGQRTIDSTILKALRKKQDLASWTADAWRRELTDESESLKDAA